MKHGIGDCFCWNAAILSFLFIHTKFQIKGNYFLGHCFVPVSFQSRSSRPLTYLVWCAMFQIAWFLVLLLCSVLRSVKKGRILLTTWRTSTVKKMSLRKFVWTVPRNLSAVLQEFIRMRVEWCNIIIMLVTCALKRRNGTHTKRNIFNGAFKDIWDAIFTFICKLEYIRIWPWPCSAITKFSLSERY